MIELYVLATLGAIGYLANKTNNQKKVYNDRMKLRKSDIPSMNNAYTSTFAQETKNITAEKAARMYQKSQNPVASKVINQNYPQQKTHPVQKKFKSMSGEEVDESHFKHNNMIPFFGSRIRQNMDDDANASLLETYTGVSENPKRKCEVQSLFDRSKNVGNVNGMGNFDDFYKDRMVAPTIRNNELPFNQQKIGKGVGKNVGDNPTGGFHQFEIQDYVRPKCVDELRVATKPKTTYDGRILDGQKGSMRGDVGKVEKNRVNTYYEQTEDHLFKTTGAYLKPTEIPEFNVKETNRLDTTTEYMGTAVSTDAKARSMDPTVRPATKEQFEEYGVRNASLAATGTGTKDDYGKSKILVFSNERDITTTRVHQGNLTSLIKAIVAPIEDLIKTTRKDESIDNPRHFGNMSIQIPEKGAVYDPNDAARTTIKETTIHDAIISNLKGNEKGTIHDPNDTARTTVKETTIHDAILSNLKGNEKGTIHDPNDVARTTVKETTIHDAILGNLSGNKKITVHDPNDIARTTIKETLIHDDTDSGNITGPKQLYVYDPDEIAKTTLRETLDSMEYVMNMSGGAKKGTVYDPSDAAKTTMKETTEHLVRDGNIDASERQGTYDDNYDAKTTQRQFTSDVEYFGHSSRDIGGGYETNEHDAKITQKQFTSDYEYFGQAEASSDKKQMSYEDMYNAFISASKESVLHGRAPTQSGNKVAADKNAMNIIHKKQECDFYSERAIHNIDKVNNNICSLSDDSLTRMKKAYGEDTRLDPALLKAFLDNPYTQSLNSVA